MGQPAAIDVVTVGRLNADQVDDVQRIVTAAAEADGVHPLSEHVALHLSYGGDAPVRSILAISDGTVVGYCHLDVTDVVEGASAEVVVDPAWRARGVGRALVSRAVAETADGRLRLWAHGELPGAVALATHLGFERIRALWQMRRSLLAPLKPPVVPPGIAVRPFHPGEDDDAWVKLNATAFAEHPEQGLWTITDLHQRMRERWFDPAGFFVAERSIDGVAPKLVGFHWTKVHGAAGAAHGHEPIAEVYVVGVDPVEQGTGLGTALTLIGLCYLRTLGLAQVMLYVDESNTAAIKVYERIGFTHWDTDVMYRNREPRLAAAGN